MPNWNVWLSRSAQKTLTRAPRPERERLQHALDEMALDPFAGDVLTLKGEERSSFRRRVGAWRIFFDVERDVLRVSVVDIARRTTTTYRRR